VWGDNAGIDSKGCSLAVTGEVFHTAAYALAFGFDNRAFIGWTRALLDLKVLVFYMFSFECSVSVSVCVYVCLREGVCVTVYLTPPPPRPPKKKVLHEAPRCTNERK